MNEERNEKIERYKRKQQTIEKVKAVKKKMTENKQDDSMEEYQREYYLLLLNQFIQETIENLKFVKEEKELLEYAEKNITEEQLKDLREKKNQKSNDPNDKIIQIPIESNMKQKIFSEVFMDRNPATMSLEEFAEEEMKKLRVQGKKQKEQEMMEQQKLEKQTDPDEETDEDILKKREWDDWKDWHPKGMGNMKK
jgi:immunoglobulin-binding protein 1